MTFALRLIQQAVADPNFINITPIAQLPSEGIEIHDIQLDSERFRAIPDLWRVMSVQPPLSDGLTETLLQLLQQQRTEYALHSSRVPELVLMLCKNAGAFREEIRNATNVLVLDPRDFDEGETVPKKHPRSTPLAYGLRRRLPRAHHHLPGLEMYRGQQPVVGWRFFGRARQLDSIVYSDRSYLVVGARRIGKTSLMREAERRMRADGRPTMFLDVQDLKSHGEVIRYLVDAIDPKYALNFWKRVGTFDERPLELALRLLVRRQGRVTVFLDELGNVIKRDPGGAWGFFGTLRKFVHSDQLRFVISCFQEAGLAHQKNFSGPLVNFTNEIRLEPFTRSEAEKFIIDPWDFWHPIDPQSRKEVREILWTEVGTHPLFLQFLGQSLFARLREQKKLDDMDFLAAFKQTVHRDRVDTFRAAMNTFFYDVDAPTAKFLLLERCRQHFQEYRKTRRSTKRLLHDDLSRSFIDDSWLETTLRSAGYDSTTIQRRNVLLDMEFFGFCRPVEGRHSQYQIVVPLVFDYISQDSPPNVGELIASLQSDIGRDTRHPELEKIQE